MQAVAPQSESCYDRRRDPPSAASATRPTSGAPEAEDVVEQLDRILASGDFDASPRSRAFIRFIVEETLAGRQEALTQAAIATRVFGRREDFDPTVDPIVRIQAGRLRRSLERYYLLSGAADPVRIDLPRGSYVPAARWGGESPERVREGRAAQGPAERDGWPCVVVRVFEVDGSERGARARRRRGSRSSSASRWVATATCASCGGARSTRSAFPLASTATSTSRDDSPATERPRASPRACWTAVTRARSGRRTTEAPRTRRAPSARKPPA